MKNGMDAFQDAMELLAGGKAEAAEGVFRRLAEDKCAPPTATARALLGLGRSLFAQRKEKEGLEAFRASVTLLRRLATEDDRARAELSLALQTLAFGQLSVERYADSEIAGEEALALAEALFGLDSPQAAKARFSLSAAFYRQKKYEAAEKLLLGARDIWEKMPEKER